MRLAYPDLDPDLADAINVVLPDRHKTNVLLTLDRVFRVVLPLSPRFADFQLLPTDGASS